MYFLYGKEPPRLDFQTAQHSAPLFCVSVEERPPRSGGLSDALTYWGALLGLTAGTAQRGQAVYYLLEFWPEWLAAILACLPIRPALQAGLEGRGGWRERLLVWGPKLLALSYAQLVTGSFNPFIYYRF